MQRLKTSDLMIYRYLNLSNRLSFINIFLTYIAEPCLWQLESPHLARYLTGFERV